MSWGVRSRSGGLSSASFRLAWPDATSGSTLQRWPTRRSASLATERSPGVSNKTVAERRRKTRTILAVGVLATLVIGAAVFVTSRMAGSGPDKIPIIRGAIQLTNIDYGRNISVHTGDVLQLTLTVDHGEPGYLVPVSLDSNALTPLSEVAPRHRTLNASFKADHPGSTQLRVAYGPVPFGAMPAIWDVTIVVSNPPPPPIQLHLSDRTRTMHLDQGATLEVTLPPLHGTGWVRPTVSPPGALSALTLTNPPHGTLIATFRAARPGPALLSTHYVCQQSDIGGCSVAGWDVKFIVSGIPVPGPRATTAPPVPLTTQTGSIDLNETDNGRTVYLRTDDIVSYTLTADNDMRWGPLTIATPGVVSVFAGNLPGSTQLTGGLLTEHDGTTVFSSTKTCATGTPPGSCTPGRWSVTVVVNG
jgi:hypothetical protein